MAVDARLPRQGRRGQPQARQHTTAENDPKLRVDFIDLEVRWLFLARSYEFTERLTDFSDETKRQADKLPKV